MSTNPNLAGQSPAYAAPVIPLRPAEPVVPAPKATARHGAWPRYLGVWAAAVVAILGILHADTVHMVMRWWNSSTYGHCLLIPPILAWLVWLRKDALGELAPRPWLPGVLLMLGAGLVWMVGYLGGVALARHAGLVLMLIFSVPTIFGLAVARGLTFPLFFALFMIPVGEQMEPAMQTITADMSMLFLDWAGVPAFNSGVMISIPNGEFEVAEACSGVRFLIAMVAFGALVANVCFKSWTRRLAFMAAAILLPIIANGIRAWGTIYIAHLTTPEFARGVDHVVYGWIFFAVVMALLLAVGWRYFDRPVDDPFIDPARLQAPGTRPAATPRLLAAAIAAVVAAGALPAYAALTESLGTATPTRGLRFTPPPGWRETAFEGIAWKPIYDNPDAELFRTFVDAEGQPVDVYLAVYDRQYEGHEVVKFGQGLIDVRSEEMTWSWAANAPAPPGALGRQINYGTLARDVIQYYWVNGKLVGSAEAAKVETLKARALGGEQRAATLIVSSQRADNLVSQRPTIERFLGGIGPADDFIVRSIQTAGSAG